MIVAASALLGFAWNAFSGRGIPLRANAYLEAGDQELTAAQAHERLGKGAVFLDARPLPFYEMSHIPGALPLPQDDFDRSFARLEPKLRRSFDVIVYCAGFGCEASHIVSRKLKEKGIQAVILSEGWPAWTDAGYPVKEGAEP